MQRVFAEPGGPWAAPRFGKWTPELDGRVGHVGRLVPAGVSTDCCVLSTALAAADAGVEVLVVTADERLGENRLGENRLGENRLGENRPTGA